MSVYAARMKRNLRETIQDRDALLRRVQHVVSMCNETIGRAHIVDSRIVSTARIVLHLMQYIESGDDRTYEEFNEAVH